MAIQAQNVSVMVRRTFLELDRIDEVAMVRCNSDSLTPGSCYKKSSIRAESLEL